jgi:hypothetical protein
MVHLSPLSALNCDGEGSFPVGNELWELVVLAFLVDELDLPVVL